MYPCSLYMDFSVSQSINKSIWCAHGTCCMSLTGRQFYNPQERNTVHLYKVIIFLFLAAVRTMCGIMGLWEFCKYVI